MLKTNDKVTTNLEGATLGEPCGGNIAVIVFLVAENVRPIERQLGFLLFVVALEIESLEDRIFFLLFCRVIFHRLLFNNVSNALWRGTAIPCRIVRHSIKFPFVMGKGRRCPYICHRRKGHEQKHRHISIS